MPLLSNLLFLFLNHCYNCFVEQYFETLITLVVRQNERISVLEQHLVDIKKTMAQQGQGIAENEILVGGAGARRPHAATAALPLKTLADLKDWLDNIKKSNSFKDIVVCK